MCGGKGREEALCILLFRRVRRNNGRGREQIRVPKCVKLRIMAWPWKLF